MKRTLCLFLALILAVGICFSAPVTITASAAEALSVFAADANVNYDIIATAMTAAELKDAMAAWLADGNTDISILLTAYADQEMFSAIWTAFSESTAADGSINLTISGAKTVPDNGFFDYANYCENDEKNIAGDKLKSLTLTDVETIGDDAFSACTYLESVNLPQVVTIGKYAFNKWEKGTKLTTLDLPNATTIGNGAFAYSSLLTSVNLPKVVTIGTVAFGYCDLRTLILPEATTIGGGAFMNNDNLVSCSAPKATTIGYYPWGSNGTSKLERLELTAAGDFTLGNNLFANTPTEQIDLVLNIDKKDQVTQKDDGTATWATTNQYGGSLTYTFKSITLTCVDGTTNHSYTYTDQENGTHKAECTVEGCGFYKYEAHTSDANSYTDNNDGTHDATCTACGAVVVDNEAHTGGTATCTTLAVCESCGVSYGEFGDHTYKNGKCTAEGCGYACAHETITDSVCVACGGNYCGTDTTKDKVIWFYDEATKTITISGSGAMADYYRGDDMPWYNYQNNITKVVIENGVTTIGNIAFFNCIALKTIEIPDSVTTIGNGAFYCTSLTTIKIPDSVTTIGYYAFNSCQNLMTITIPESVTEIGELAFNNCASLTSITVDENNDSYLSEDGILFNRDKSVLICCPAGKEGDYEVPSGVTTIGNNAFSNCVKLQSVTIPVNVETIGEETFAGCEYVNLIVEPGSKAHNYAKTNNIPYIFNGYTKEETAQIKKLTFTLNADSESYSVTGCDTPISGELKIPATYNGKPVTEIGNYAFPNCTSLTSVTIPGSVTTIADWAFSSCTELTEIKVAEGNTNYLSVDGILFNAEKTELLCYPAGKKGNYEIPTTVTEIAPGAFSGNTSLESVTIPDRVTTIGEGAFMNCTALTSVTIPDSVTTIGRYAFQGCTSLASVTIGDRVKTIDWMTFYDCTELTSVTIGKGVTEINGSAFDCCNKLSTVNVPCDWDTENPLYAFDENVNVEVADHKEIIYVDNNDGTHTAKYSCCGTVIGEPEKHSFDESEYCEFCEYQCPHEKYSNGVCDVCECYCPHTNTEPVYKSYEDNTNRHYKYYECCGLEEWAGYHEDENGDTKCDQCEVQLVAKAYLEPWTSQGVKMGDNYFVSLENAVDKVNEIYGEELFLLSDATIAEDKTITLESAVFNTNGNKLTVNGILVLSAKKYTGTTIPDGVIGSGTIKIGENTFKFADNEKWSCAEESQHTGSVQTCVGYLCELCGNYYGEANDNHEIVIDEAKAPTCTKTGLTEGQHCTRCDDKTVAQEVVPALNHKGTLVQVEAKAKTCTTVGWEAYEYCTACDYTTKVEIPASHEIVKVNAKAKTCTEAGHNAHEYCTECDYTTKVVIPASHELQEVKAKAPTCEAIGYDAYKYCTECDYTTYKEKAKLGHYIVIDKAVEATCTETGLTEGSHCTRCNDKTVEQDVIPKKGHTETKGGTPDVHTKCDVCEDVLSAEHEFASKITTEPTYTKEGVKTFTCECGYSYEEVIPCLIPGEIEAELDNSNSFSATVEDVNSITAKLKLTDEEKELISNGADMKIVFKLSDIGSAVNTAEKEAILNALTKGEIGTFLDIQLVKQIGGMSTNVKNLSGLISVSVELPAELINNAVNVKRSYSVLRYHDGDEQKVTTLNSRYDEATHTLTFDTDRFSTYAIVYSDVVVSSGEGVQGTPDYSDGAVGAPETPKDDVPKAGVISTTSIWLGAMAISGFGALLVSKKKKED